MAYMNQERKAKLAPNIKAVLKKYGMKGTISVRSNMVLVVTVKSGKLDILQNWFDTATKDSPTNRYGDVIEKPKNIQVNEFYIEQDYTGEVKDFLLELLQAMKGDEWYDRSDIQSDFFDVSWYLDINVGNWDKPYVCTK